MEKEIREHPDDEKTEDPGLDPVEETGPGEGLEAGGDGTGAHRHGEPTSAGADSGRERSHGAGARPESDGDGDAHSGADDDAAPEDHTAFEGHSASEDREDGTPGTEPEPEPEAAPEPEPERGQAYKEPVIDYGSLSGDDPSGEASFGTWLRRQREMREIDLRDIASQTKISLRYLKAMEADRFDILPAPVFARGFLKEYSRYVGLNADEVVNYYLAAHQSGEAASDGSSDEPTAMSTESRGPVSRTFLLALVLALLAAAALYFYLYQRSNESHEEAQPPPIAAPATSPLDDLPPEPEGDEATDARAAPLVVTLDFTQECWLEAQVDRTERTSRLFVAGESLQLEAEEIVVLENVGNVDGVQVQVNGEPFDLPSSGRDATARDVIIDRDSFDTGAAGGDAGATDGGGGAGNLATGGP